MATVSLVIAMPHNPFHLRNTSRPRDSWSDDTVRMAATAEAMAERLRRVKPDVIVMVANDHYHQFFLDNMPAFLIGKMDRFDGIFHNEIREFGMAPCTIPGDPNLAAELIEGGFERRVDFSYSDQLRLDHAFVTPLLHFRLNPELNIPIVPVLTNCVAPPLPPARRFIEVGIALRETIDALPAATRVAIIATGNLSLDVGGQRQFGPTAPDRAFDERVGELMADQNLTGLADFCSFERMAQAGTVTHAVLNLLTGVAMTDGLVTTHADAMLCAGSSQPWFAWEPRAA